MKAKIFFTLSMCCFLVSIGIMVGLAVVPGVQAQQTQIPVNQSVRYLGGDGDWDYNYDIETDTINNIEPEGNNTVLYILAIIFIIIIIIGYILVKRR